MLRSVPLFRLCTVLQCAGILALSCVHSVSVCVILVRSQQVRLLLVGQVRLLICHLCVSASSRQCVCVCVCVCVYALKGSCVSVKDLHPVFKHFSTATHAQLAHNSILFY